MNGLLVWLNYLTGSYPMTLVQDVSNCLFGVGGH